MLYSFDLETFLIGRTNKAPKPVCASMWSGNGEPLLVRPDDPAIDEMLYGGDHLIVGHNISYDIIVHMRWHPEFIQGWIRALEEGRVFDTMLREQLLHLEVDGDRGFPSRCSLASLVLKYLNQDVSADKVGDDIWRLKYGVLDTIPIDRWPSEAIRYAKDDAVHTFQVFWHQGGVQYSLPTEALQVRASVALQATSAWGMKTNQQNVEELAGKLSGEIESLSAQIKELGITGKGSQKRMAGMVLAGWHAKHTDMIVAIAQSQGVGVDVQALHAACPNTDNLKYWLSWFVQNNPQGMPPWCWDPQGWNPIKFVEDLAKSLPDVPMSSRGPKTGEEDLTAIFDYVPTLKVRADLKHVDKMYSTYIKPYLGTRTVHPRFSTVVTTGRTAASKPNTQNVPRDGGFRKNLHCRAGYSLGTVDWSAVELGTLAATIIERYGASKLADEYNAGRDLHCLTAAMMTGKPYAEFINGKDADGCDKPRKEPPYKNDRQSSKAANFGLPGGLGVKAFVAYAKGSYGVELSEQEARRLIKAWKQTWPEVVQYLQDNADLVDNSEGRRATAVNNSGRKKANCTYTQLSNYPFQSLAADGAKQSLWNLFKEQMLAWYWNNITVHRTSWGQEHAGSPLIYSHTVNFVHDEIVMEHPRNRAEEPFERQKEIMLTTMREFTVGVNTRIEGELSQEWGH